MKSLAGSIGNVNLRGKKFKVLRCRCCVAEDLREWEEERWARKEIEQAFVDFNDGYKRAA